VPVVGVKVGGNGEEEVWKVVVGYVEEEEEEWEGTVHEGGREDEDEIGNAAIRNPKKIFVNEGKKGGK